MTKRKAPPPLVLTVPEAGPQYCKACGKVVKSMRRHAGSAKCANEARRAMIDRLGHVEVWYSVRKLLVAAGLPVVVIRDQKDGKDRKRWYSAPGPVQAIQKLFEAGLADRQIIRLIGYGMEDELARELAHAALAGPKALWPPRVSP